MNNRISKSEAITKACLVFREKQNAFTELYVSVDVMKVEQIKDYCDEMIFKHLPEEIPGWLFFFEPMPFANWEHHYQYLLIVDENCVEQVAYQRGVADTVQLEKVY